MNEIQPSTLYIVSTPIGNLEDVTFRAINTLKAVDIIACEDTRRSLKLLNHYDIKKKLITYHSYNEKNSANGIITLLESGKAVALISDGGTPCISDPGFILVNECRKKELNVIAIPGPAAFVTLLSVSGFRTDKFYFHGFLSIKEGQRAKALEKASQIEATHIFYESPHRLNKLVNNICEIFTKKMICIGKELTKINETIIYGDSETIKEKLTNVKILGEYVILIANY
jgi:16S rRNA (cytidine1402-2'-O)-methyltransferase